MKTTTAANRYPNLRAALCSAAIWAIRRHLGENIYTTNDCITVDNDGDTVFGWEQHSSDNPYNGFAGNKPFEGWIDTPLQISDGNPVFADLNWDNENELLATYANFDDIPEDVLEKTTGLFADYAILHDSWDEEYLN